MPQGTGSYTPLYAKVKQDIVRKIRTGEYAPGMQLPTTIELMNLYGVSDGTIKRTMRELVQDGLIYTVYGKGSFIVDRSPSPEASARPVITIVYGRRQNEVIGNLFYSGILHGVEQELMAHGMGLELVSLKVSSLAEVVESRKRGMYPAVLVITTLRADEMRELARYGHATVSLIIETPPIDGLYCLVNDDVAGGRTATAHLVEQGCRRIGAIVVPQKASYVQSRWQGYVDALAQHSIELDETLIEPGDWTMEGGYLAMRQLLQRRPDVDGVFAMNDMMAIGAAGAAMEAGRSIPGDLKMVGYDDIEFARFFHPSLTTMRVDRQEMGRRVVAVLLQRLEQQNPPFAVERIAPRLVVRESTGGRSQRLQDAALNGVATPPRPPE